jgi:ABC-type nitrate/sulfonate/bicarbonate transport system substrate-binding protein
MNLRAWHLLGLALLAMTWLGTARADPVTIRLGYSTAAEEQLWLLLAKPDIGSNFGKAYTIDGTRFPGSDKRMQAFAAGAIDIGSGSAGGTLFAAVEGIPMRLIASLSRESPKGDFSTSFLVMADSPIKTIEDLKGRTVSVNGFSTAGELWLRAALERHGLHEQDVTVVPIAFPAMAESLKSGRIDCGEFPQPFAAMAEKDMKLRTLFTAKEGAPFDEELIVLMAQPAFLAAHPEAVRAFLADLHAATLFYLAHPQEARQILIDKKYIRVPADVYLTMKDYYRDPSMRVDAEALKRDQDLQIKAGFQKQAVDVDKLVDNSYLPQ